MQVRRMNRGERWAHTTGEHEYVHVILGGICHIRTSAGDFLNVGRRPNVFSGMPYAVYLSRRTEFVIEALTDGFEVATCWVPTGEDHPAQLVTPADSEIELRGGANASRQINGIIPPGFDCHRIVCVEVYTPGGNWSSYPPHKHDVHREDEQGNLLEADLEEIYFYKLDRPGGYAYQRVYNDDRSIDAVMMAEHHRLSARTATPPITLTSWQARRNRWPIRMTRTTPGSKTTGHSSIPGSPLWIMAWSRVANSVLERK